MVRPDALDHSVIDIWTGEAAFFASMPMSVVSQAVAGAVRDILDRRDSARDRRRET